MLDLLEDYMELRSIPYARLDGGTTRPRRNLDIKLVGVISGFLIHWLLSDAWHPQFQQEKSRKS